MNGPPASKHTSEPAGLTALPARSTAGQLRLLLRFSEMLAAATTVEQVSAAVDEVACDFLGAIFGGVAVADHVTGTLRFLSLRRLPESLQRSRLTAQLDSPRPASMVAREHRPLFLSSLAEATRVMDEDSLLAARASGGHAFAYLPLLLDDQAVGTLALVWAQELPFDEASRRLLGALAQYTAQAVDRARLLAERRQVAHTLQAALLPVLPTLPWLPMCGFYRPAGGADLVGGDWYDAFVSVPGGRGRGGETVTTVVGDVTGHDTYAAAEMGRLQAKLRALAIDHPDEPDLLIQRLDKVMLANPHNRLATAIVANVTTDGSGSVTFSWCSAGHLPPLLLEPGDAPCYLHRPADTLLGLAAGIPRHRHAIRLPPGSTVVMYTDGLIERRDRDIDEGLAALARAAADRRTADLEPFVRALADELLATEPGDDTVIFAVRNPGVVGRPSA